MCVTATVANMEQCPRMRHICFNSARHCHCLMVFSMWPEMCVCSMLYMNVCSDEASVLGTVQEWQTSDDHTEVNLR